MKGVWQRPRGLTSARFDSSAQVQVQDLVVIVASTQWTIEQVQWVEWNKEVSFKLPEAQFPNLGPLGWSAVIKNSTSLGWRYYTFLQLKSTLVET